MPLRSMRTRLAIAPNGCLPCPRAARATSIEVRRCSRSGGSCTDPSVIGFYFDDLCQQIHVDHGRQAQGNVDLDAFDAHAAQVVLEAGGEKQCVEESLERFVL